MVAADHPLPSERERSAARRLLELADGLRAGDLAIACFTGGSSALTSLPPDGVTLAEKRRLHELLLRSGMPIIEVNAVRKHVSAIKGGRLAAPIAPARVLNLTVSDVARDLLDAITDPSVQDTSTVADALAALNDRGLWDARPGDDPRPPVQRRRAESPQPRGRETATLARHRQERLPGDGRGGRRHRVAAHVVSTELEGEARELGRFVANLARESAAVRHAVRRAGVLLGCGGESDRDRAARATFGAGGPEPGGRGGCGARAGRRPGRGRHASTRTAPTAARRSPAQWWTARRSSAPASSGSTCARRSWPTAPTAALAALGDVFVTGPTGTNVNDMFVIAVGEVSA